jgi:glyoxylase-like metal-dependent hydrolase (beta-lactamase superfamily II)
MREIAEGVAVFPTLIANAYLVGDAASWALVDSCTPGHERRIRRAAEHRFGPGARPRAIILTHGHFDHAGCAGPLADLWNVPIYAHARELAFLTGQARYPPMDYSSPGFFTRLARFFPTSTVNLGSRVRAFEPGALPGLETWQMVETHGHTPGHVSFFRPRDAVLLAGDAVTTMNLDGFFDTIGRRKQVCRPPVPATSDWLGARDSVRLLARLHPDVIAAGHGVPMRGAAGDLPRLADGFQIPVRAIGRQQPTPPAT